MPLPFLAHLGLDANADGKAIRRAYAQRLRQIDPSTQADEFQALNEAYRTALAWHASREVPGETAPSSEVGPRIEHGEETSAPTRTPAPTDPPSEEPAEAWPANEVVVYAALDEFSARIARTPPPDAAAAEHLLAEFLERTDLIDVDCRLGFEWGVAAILANGWRPGHEHVFAAAMVSFDWREDRRRLGMLGGAGAVVDRAIEELQAYNAQPAEMRDFQRDAIRRLRRSEPPTTRELLRFLPTVERVAVNFPHMAHVLTVTGALPAWRSSYERVPGWRRRWAGSDAERRAPVEATRSDWGKYVGVLMILAVLLQAGKWAGSSSSSSGSGFHLDTVLKDPGRPMPPNLELTGAPVFVVPPAPQYPASARRDGLEGKVVVGLSLDAAGALLRAEVLSSSGHRALDDAALAAVRGARYAANQANLGVPGQYAITIRFALTD